MLEEKYEYDLRRYGITTKATSSPMHLLAIGEEVAIKEILQFSIPTESASQLANKEKYMFR